MKEGKIIQFKRPGSENSSKQADPVNNEGDLLLEKAKKVFNFEDSNDQEQDSDLNPVVLVILLEFLTNLRKGKPFNLPSARNIELRRQGIENSSDGWLYARVNRSTEADWKRQPTFYDAVISELKRRKKI